MVTVDIIDEQNFTDVAEREELESLLNFAYSHLNQEEEAEVSVSFVEPDEIQTLNRNYRNKDRVTDVISFSMEENDEDIIHEAAMRVLGDIIICTERVKSQAIEYGHSYRRELLFLALHGFLHLLGYDHIESEDEEEMNRAQDEILEAFNVTRN